jgi:hypothetical protein
MTVDAFCSKYDVPRTRTRRSVRDLAREVLAEQEQIPRGKLAGIDLSEYHLEPTEREGVRIEKPGGHERFSYTVTKPEVLAAWLRGVHGKDLLTSRDTDQLLELAELLLNAAEWEGPWQLERSVASDRPDRSREEIGEEVRHLLQKAGRID